MRLRSWYAELKDEGVKELGEKGGRVKEKELKLTFLFRAHWRLLNQALFWYYYLQHLEIIGYKCTYMEDPCSSLNFLFRLFKDTLLQTIINVK